MRPQKVFTIILAVICVLLGLQIIGLQLIDVTEIDLQTQEPKPVPELPEFSLSNEAVNDALTAEILQRPLFSDTRKPKPLGEADSPEEEKQPEALAQAKLDVEVRGIIIGPDYRIATVRDKKTKKTITLREGDHFEGELGAWALDSVNSRKLAFSNSQNGESTELELKVYKGKLAGKGQKTTNNRRRDAAKKGQNTVLNPGKKDEGNSQADEIRRKVAERRARMRAEAAKKRAKKNNQSDNK
ncbi:MAG: hypothetical protein ACWA5R_14550 [bacterium]